MLNKDELKKRAKAYFISGDIKEIHATEDGQFFYETYQAKKYAGGKMNTFSFSKNDLEEKEKSPKEILQEKAKNLEIRFNSKTTVDELEKLIAKKEGDK